MGSTPVELDKGNEFIREGDSLDSETFRKLCGADWGTIGAELLAFAAWRAKNYQWYSGQGRELAPGISLEDIIQEVIAKTISGKRHWDPARGPLVPWLKDVVKSEVDNKANSAPNRYEKQALEGKGEEKRPQASDLRRPPNPEVSERVQDLMRAVNGEPELKEVLEAVMDGCEPTPRHLAAELDVPIEEMRDRVKKLRGLATNKKRNVS